MKDSRYAVYDDRSVYFKTDSGAGYLVSFIKDENLGISNTYQVVVANDTDSVSSGLDPKIGQTVASILKSFFENKDHVLLYLCDPTDRHEAARNRKFCGWFNRYADKDSLAMINEAIVVEDITYYVSVIYNKQMSKASDLETTFRTYIQDLKSKEL